MGIQLITVCLYSLEVAMYSSNVYSGRPDRIGLPSSYFAKLGFAVTKVSGVHPIEDLAVVPNEAEEKSICYVPNNSRNASRAYCF